MQESLIGPSSREGPAAQSRGSLGNLAPSHSEIEAVFQPYVMREMSVDSAEWQKLKRKRRSHWRRLLWKERLRRWRWRAYRSPESVRKKYQRIWAEQSIPLPSDEGAPLRYCSWGQQAYVIQYGGHKRLYLMMLGRAIAACGPKNVLEVGAGNGANLLTLSSAFPGVGWAGVELSPAGVERACSVQRAAELPEAVRDFSPWPVLDGAAFRAIDFRQGDARRLPFPDESFDLVYTCLALEQMESIRDEAIREVCRVSARWVVFVEPFADYNQDPLRSTYITAQSYFSLKVDDLSKYGLKVLTRFADFPQKLTIAYALVVAEKTRGS